MMGALLDGGHNGDVTTQELLQHGNFRPGTFNRLDSDMLVLEAVCYQLRSDGSARVADLDQLTPFAAATWF
jgi:acetolactate decarboxylase